MYGYEVILTSPSRDRQVGLRFMSPKRFSSVVSLLREQGAYSEYRDWKMMSFRCVHAQTPRSRPVEVANQLAAPGTLLTTAV